MKKIFISLLSFIMLISILPYADVKAESDLVTREFKKYRVGLSFRLPLYMKVNCATIPNLIYLYCGVEKPGISQGP